MQFYEYFQRVFHLNCDIRQEPVCRMSKAEEKKKKKNVAELQIVNSNLKSNI